MRTRPRAFIGIQLRRLREERGLTQAALARRLDISPSYLNQIERNQRPLTVSVLLRINEVLDIDVRLLSDDEEARLIAGVHDALSDSVVDEPVSLEEVKELAAGMPAVGRALISMHRRLQAARERIDELAAGLGDDPAGEAGALRPAAMAYEEVRDFFYDNRNHFPALDEVAERLAEEAGLVDGAAADTVRGLLAQRHDVRVVVGGEAGLAPGERRLYDAEHRVLHITDSVSPGRQAFQMATQLAFLEVREQLHALTDDAPALSSDESRALARIGLANYFAGAVVMPYGRILAAAEDLAYDVELLGRRFGMGFESICHRLSTLQRPGARGVPFFFVRVDRAGNISKRQSATDFHFSRVGGSCPLWNVHEAFAAPGQILRQIAQMPDGRAYLWVARTVSHHPGGFGTPAKTFAVGLGCDIRHASRLVYAKGLALDDPEAATPIGGGCKICERPACPQRAFPPVGRPLVVDEDRNRFEPYRAA